MNPSGLFLPKSLKEKLTISFEQFIPACQWIDLSLIEAAVVEGVLNEEALMFMQKVPKKGIAEEQPVFFGDNFPVFLNIKNAERVFCFFYYAIVFCFLNKRDFMLKPLLCLRYIYFVTFIWHRRFLWH